MSEQEIESETRAYSSLGEHLLEGVRNLWKAVTGLTEESTNHGRSIDRLKETQAYLFAELERMNQEIQAFRREIQGLKISRGRARARADRLEQLAAQVASEAEVAKSQLQRLN